MTGHPGGDGGLAVELEADPTRTFNEVVETRVRYQSPGRAQIVIRSRHPADLHWAGRRARWYSSRGSTAGGFTATYPGRSLTLYVIPT